MPTALNLLCCPNIYLAVVLHQFEKYFSLQEQVTKDYDAVVFDVLRVNAEDIAVSTLLHFWNPVSSHISYSVANAW